MAQAETKERLESPSDPDILPVGSPLDLFPQSSVEDLTMQCGALTDVDLAALRLKIVHMIEVDPRLEQTSLAATRVVNDARRLLRKHGILPEETDESVARFNELYSQLATDKPQNAKVAKYQRVVESRPAEKIVYRPPGPPARPDSAHGVIETFALFLRHRRQGRDLIKSNTPPRQKRFIFRS